MTQLIREIHRIPDFIIDKYSARLDFTLRNQSLRSQAETLLTPNNSLPTDEEWVVTATFGSGNGMPENATQALMAVFRRGGGVSGYYTIYPASYRYPLGDATGDFSGNREDRLGPAFADGVITQGGFATGVNTAGRIRGNFPVGSQFIRVSLMQPNRPRSVALGDHFSILNVKGSYPTLHYADADSPSDADGVVTIPIRPYLSYPAKQGEVVEFYKPRQIVQLQTEPSVATVPPNHTVVSCSFVGTKDFLRRLIPGSGDEL